MSGTLPKSVADCRMCSAKAKLLFFELSTFTNAKRRYCFPSQFTLAQRLGISYRQVKRLLTQHLYPCGHVELLRRGNEGMTNIYVLHFEPPERRRLLTPETWRDYASAADTKAHVGRRKWERENAIVADTKLQLLQRVLDGVTSSAERKRLRNLVDLLPAPKEALAQAEAAPLTEKQLKALLKRQRAEGESRGTGRKKRAPTDP